MQTLAGQVPGNFSEDRALFWIEKITNTLAQARCDRNSRDEESQNNQAPNEQTFSREK